MGKQPSSSLPMSYELHSWARSQRSIAIGDLCRRAIGTIWRSLVNRQPSRDHGACAGASPARNP